MNVVIPNSYDMEVAGPALIMLLAAIPFYWSLIILIEKGICNCRKSKAIDREDIILNQNYNA